ncbi:MAG: ABC transporter permease [Spirochaetales bacterium]|nr:ABC transporter permease [Spirochaetales bacterium]
MAEKKLVSRLMAYKVSFTLIVFVALLAVFQIFTPNHTFFQRANLFSLARLAPDLGIVALGVGILMICGEFDLSVASTIPMSSFVFVKLLGMGLPLWIDLILTLCVGVVIGLLNGLLVTRTRLPSFILTLGTMLFWRGLVYAASRMMPIGIRSWLDFGSWLENMFVGSIGGIFPVQALWFVGIAILLGIVLHRTRFGNWIFVTGDNQTAALAMGINTDRVKIICYIIVGVLCSVMGLMQCLRIESFAANQGVGFELKAIASAVVGGTALMGGIGSVLGIFLGTLTIQIIENGVILLGFPAFGIGTFIGAVVILFAVLNKVISRFSYR